MRVIYMPEFYEMGLAAAMAEARRVVGDGPTYVSFDIDSLDPAYAPGTGTPEVGGFTTLEAQLMIRSLQGLDLVGADVVEVVAAVRSLGAHRARRRLDDVRAALRARRCPRGPPAGGIAGAAAGKADRRRAIAAGAAR